ncbi:MAG: hypothetical protein ACTTIX_08740 [Peptoanaerobacter stomatis]
MIALITMHSGIIILLQKQYLENYLRNVLDKMKMMKVYVESMFHLIGYIIITK